MDNYEYCAFVARSLFSGRDQVRILDYGCGAGQIVALLKTNGFDVWGCDIFYDGGNYSNKVVDGLLGSRIQRIVDGRIPFDDAIFDLVISNQVLEHVADLDAVLDEISRVLKPNGLSFHMFPDKGVYREGHCGIAFLHWFPKHNRTIRLYYAYMMRSLGLGFHTENKSRLQWSRDICDWLDRWTHYRSYRKIQAAFQRHFGPFEHREVEWIEKRYPASRFLPAFLKSAISRKWGGVAFTCRKIAR